MFKSILNIYSSSPYQYLLVDDMFECTILMKAASHGAAAVIQTYQQRDLPVVQNLLLYYLWYMNMYNVCDRVHLIAKNEKTYIDAWYPELKYGNLYYSQVLDKLQKILMVS